VLYYAKDGKLQDAAAKDYIRHLNEKYNFTNLEQTGLHASVHVQHQETWDYAQLSGDINPIHVSEILGVLFGQSGMIAHGAMVLGKALSTLKSEKLD